MQSSAIPTAHASSITGAHCLTPAVADRAGLVRIDAGRIATCSADQRLAIWRVGETLELASMGDGLIADAQAMAALPDGRVIVVGIGIECWRVHRDP